MGEIEYLGERLARRELRLARAIIRGTNGAAECGAVECCAGDGGDVCVGELDPEMREAARQAGCLFGTLGDKAATLDLRWAWLAV